VTAELTFDYEGKVWGAPQVRLTPTYIQALKLRYCLEDMEGIRGKVLDIGCGGGNMPKAIRHYRPDLDVWGTDLSQHALKTALAAADGTHFVAAGGEQLPFPDGFFDAVTMFDVLEHIPDPIGALREIQRVLRPGGLFHLFLPLERQPFTIYALLFRLGWKSKQEHCGHIQFYSDRICKDQLEQAGFDMTRRRWSIHPVYAMVDVAYFTMLSLRGKHVTTSVEGFVNAHNGRPSLLQRLVGVLKDILVVLGYYESRLLCWMPGGGGHYSAIAGRPMPKEIVDV
jgi:ubiquinone/menaquinone biosynthesis C-methylase UbiE